MNMSRMFLFTGAKGISVGETYEFFLTAINVVIVEKFTKK